MRRVLPQITRLGLTPQKGRVFFSTESTKGKIFLNGENFRPLSLTATVGGSEITHKKTGRLEGEVVTESGWPYMFKNGRRDGSVKNEDPLFSRLEFIASRMVAAAINNDRHASDVLISPEVFMVKFDQNSPNPRMLLASRIMSLQSYPDKDSLEKYGDTMFDYLSARNFKPLTNMALLLSVLRSNDHPGTCFSNLGIARPSGRLAIFDFDICFGYGGNRDSKSQDRAKENFTPSLAQDFDSDRGLRNVELSTPILDVSRKPAKFKEIHSLDWSQGIFSRLTFGDVAGSPLLIGEQARKIFKQGFSQPLSNEDPRKLESTMLRLIGTTLPRFHDAWLLKSAAQTLSKGLEPEQVFPPAVKVLSMFKESEKLKELERTPAPERQKIIDELSASIPATKAKITGHQPLSDDSKSQGR